MLSELWAEIRYEHPTAGSRRVDPSTVPDFYASIDADGRPGLVLLTHYEMPGVPDFEGIDVVTTRRTDDRVTVGLWLRANNLESIFAQFCESIIAACKNEPAAAIPRLVAQRLTDWQRLLDSISGGMSTSRLRGLMAELLLFEQCLALAEPMTVTEGWVGPLGAPQDFVLPSLLLEAKATLPTSKTARISSAEQLSSVNGSRLVLAVFPLATSTKEHPAAVSPADVVSRLRKRLSPNYDASRIFNDRLLSAGFTDADDYERMFYRSEPPRFFEVRSGFPRITTDSVPPAVSGVAYDITLAACADYEILLEGIYGS